MKTRNHPMVLPRRKSRPPRFLVKDRLHSSDKDSHVKGAGGSAAAAAVESTGAAEAPAKEAEEVEELTPRQIVEELDKYVIGQKDAKRAVAIALRNRWRRWRIEEDIRDEILPNNILLIGPTGVGKTEIARRLARLAQAPFVKVEASKFTEVGYVGR